MSEVSGSFDDERVSAYRSRLFRLCGFNDKNKGGTIKKVSFFDSSAGEEGYVPQADIDSNGNITEAEAKYYIRGLKNVSPAVKKEYELTSQDISDLDNDIDYALWMKKMAMAENYTDSMELARMILAISRIGFTEKRKTELIEYSIKAAGGGFLEYPPRSLPLVAAGCELHKAGYPREKYLPMLKEGISRCLKYKYAGEESRFAEMGKILRLADLDAGDMREMIDQGLQTARGEEKIVHKASALIRLATIAVYAGAGISITAPLIDEATAAVAKISDDGTRSVKYCELGVLMKKAGYGKESIKGIINKALAIARKKGNQLEKASGLIVAAHYMADAGFEPAEVIEVCQEALQAANKADGKVLKPLLIASITYYIEVNRELMRAKGK
jgi:hypothetical protein